MNATANVNKFTKSKIWCRILVSLLITHPPHPTIKLPGIQIFKAGFRKLSILSKFWNDTNGRVCVCVCVCACVCVGGSSCLRHYDALRTKIDMWLVPYIINYSRMGYHQWILLGLRNHWLILRALTNLRCILQRIMFLYVIKKLLHVSINNRNCSIPDFPTSQKSFILPVRNSKLY